MKNNKIEFVFEDASRFRKSEKIENGIKLLIIDQNSKKHVIDIDSIPDLHGPVTMSILYNYTSIMQEVFTKIFKEFNQASN
jgi:hypothetical protein